MFFYFKKLVFSFLATVTFLLGVNFSNLFKSSLAASNYSQFIIYIVLTAIFLILAIYFGGKLFNLNFKQSYKRFMGDDKDKMSLEKAQRECDINEAGNNLNSLIDEIRK